MPVVRYQIRDEYGLADPELYKPTKRDDPEEILEGVAMAGLVGVLRQLGDLAEFAAEIFHDLHEEVMTTAVRGHALMLRVQQLEAEFPSIEKSFMSQTNPLQFIYNTGIDWHPNIQTDQNLITRGDLPRFILDSYEESRGPPRLFMLDKFDVAGAGACLKRYSDPSFFKVDLTASSKMEVEVQREKKVRKIKTQYKFGVGSGFMINLPLKRGARLRNGETPDTLSIPLATSKSLQVGPSDRNQVPESLSINHVRLKKKHLNGLPSNFRKGKSYMERILDVHVPDKKNAHEKSNGDAQLNLTMGESNESVSHIHANGSGDSSRSLLQLLRETTPSQSPDKMDMVEPSNKKMEDNIVVNGVTDSLPKSINVVKAEEAGFHVDQKDSLVDNCSVDGYRSDGVSDLDMYLDALTTMESEMESDSERRHKPDLVSINTGTLGMDSDVHEKDHGMRTEYFNTVKNGRSSHSNSGSLSHSNSEKPSEGNGVASLSGNVDIMDYVKLDNRSAEDDSPDVGGAVEAGTHIQSAGEIHNSHSEKASSNGDVIVPITVSDIAVPGSETEEALSSSCIIDGLTYLSAQRNLNEILPARPDTSTISTDHIDSRSTASSLNHGTEVGKDLDDDLIDRPETSVEDAQTPIPGILEESPSGTVADSLIKSPSSSTQDSLGDGDPYLRMGDNVVPTVNVEGFTFSESSSHEAMDNSSAGPQNVIDSCLDLTSSARCDLAFEDMASHTVEISSASQDMMGKEHLNNSVAQEPGAFLDVASTSECSSARSLHDLLKLKPRTDLHTLEDVSEPTSPVLLVESEDSNVASQVSNTMDPVLGLDIISGNDQDSKDMEQSGFITSESEQKAVDEIAVVGEPDCNVDDEAVLLGVHRNSFHTAENFDFPDAIGQPVELHTQSIDSSTPTVGMKAECSTDDPDLIECKESSTIHEISQEEWLFSDALPELPAAEFAEATSPKVLEPNAGLPIEEVGHSVVNSTNLNSEQCIPDPPQNTGSDFHISSENQCLSQPTLSPKNHHHESEKEVVPSLISFNPEPTAPFQEDIASGVVHEPDSREEKDLEPPRPENLPLREQSILLNPEDEFLRVLTEYKSPPCSDELGVSLLTSATSTQPDPELAIIPLESSIPSDSSPKAVQIFESSPHVPLLALPAPVDQQTNNDAMPPLPPLPPLQWRMGKQRQRLLDFGGDPAQNPNPFLSLPAPELLPTMTMDPFVPQPQPILEDKVLAIEWVTDQQLNPFALPTGEEKTQHEIFGLEGATQQPLLVVDNEMMQESDPFSLTQTSSESVISKELVWLQNPFVENEKPINGSVSSEGEIIHTPNPFAPMQTVEDGKPLPVSPSLQVVQLQNPFSLQDDNHAMPQHGSLSSTEMIPSQNPHVPLLAVKDEKPPQESLCSRETEQPIKPIDPLLSTENGDQQNGNPPLQGEMVSLSLNSSIPASVGEDFELKRGHRIDNIMPIVPLYGETAQSLIDMEPSPDMENVQPNGRSRSLLHRPRTPLIEEVASHDKSMLRKVSEMVRPVGVEKADERDSLLEQIRAKSFNLKPAVVTKPTIQGSTTNLKVAAILEKANAIRQAFAGSDEDDEDNWSDS
ncbi:Protein SCAR2 [Acorus calamus]|uniref:Protein SCAR n=1 Tax=Acorus calamus TaxID=4465 RepID=A0AAV9F920_ACOCL|nr:Protein SCAR2 [Acorus calamus]